MVMLALPCGYFAFAVTVFLFNNKVTVAVLSEAIGGGWRFNAL